MGERAFDRHHFDYAPWEFWDHADDAHRSAQLALQERFLREAPGSALGDRCFVSPLAAVQTDRLILGDRSTIAAHAMLSGELTFGRDCTVNVSTIVRGRVTAGDAVRIGAHTSILGFNHSFAPGVEIFRQPLTSVGIRLGDDVWVGSHVVILDGVTVGDGAVIGAGSVVTKDVPAGAVVVGNPARVKTWRRPSRTTAPDDLAARLEAFTRRLDTDLDDVLARSWRPEAGRYTDRPGDRPTLRAHCDAIQLSVTVRGAPPPQLTPEAHVERLRAAQDPATGLIPELDQERDGLDIHDGATNYHLLSVGYALDLLGSRLPHPIAYLADLTAEGVVADLEALPWDDLAWRCGHFTDAIGTGLHWNLAAGLRGRPGAIEALFGWLTAAVSPETGMWGRPRDDVGLLEVVNGFYRATRGTYAQFGVPLPYPERTIDTVLTHARDVRFFAPFLQNACNVLDVAHPLWLARRQTTHRAEEIRAVATRLLGDALAHYEPGAGFGFAAPTHDRARPEPARPGLQGTEMWISVIWLLADLLGIAEAMGRVRPCGSHRPEPARRLT